MKLTEIIEKSGDHIERRDGFVTVFSSDQFRPQHTPTPWYVCAGGCSIVEGNKSVTHAGTRGPRAEADAAFIVEAVNSHDSLVAENVRLREALAKTLDPIHGLLAIIHDGTILRPDRWAELRDYADRAIQNAQAALSATNTPPKG